MRTAKQEAAPVDPVTIPGSTTDRSVARLATLQRVPGSNPRPAVSACEEEPEAGASTQQIALAALLAVLALVVTATCVVSSLAWIDRPFPGFLLAENRIVVPVAHWDWTGRVAGVPFTSLVTEMDGERVATADQVLSRAAVLPVGQKVRYRFSGLDGERELIVPIMRFTLRDYLQLFGVYLINGLAFLAVGLGALVLAPCRPAARAIAILGLAWGMVLIVSLDDFSPWRFRALYAVSWALTPCAILYLGLTFPEPHRWSRRVPGGAFTLFLPAALLGAADLWLYHRAPLAYVRYFEVSLALIVAAALATASLAIMTFRRARSDAVRRRLTVATLGMIVSFGLPALVHVAARVAGEPLPVNLLAATNFIFPVTLAYAALRDDVLEIDRVARQGAAYLLVTVLVAGLYFSTVGSLNLVARGIRVAHTGWFPLGFALIVLVVVQPLRARVQATVDGWFERTPYDPEQVLRDLSRSLTALRTESGIASEVARALGRCLAPETVQVLAFRPMAPQAPSRESGLPETAFSERLLPEPLLPGLSPFLVGDELIMRLARNREPLSEFDRAPVGQTLRRRGISLAVGLRIADHLTGALLLGPRSSGALYGERDREMLDTVGNQIAVALAHAQAFEALVAFSRELESRVEVRTGELSASLTDLEAAHSRLAAAQAQLVQSEKAASVGRLVAGVVHEINNPLAFVSSSIDLIRDGLAELNQLIATDQGDRAHSTLEQLTQNVAICRDGAIRAAGIVRDLRTIARPTGGKARLLDLAAVIDGALRLTLPHAPQPVEINRDYHQDLPDLLGDEPQLHQLFANLFHNAVQAMPSGGRLRVSVARENGRLIARVADSGPGVSPELRERIFDPFFTTKPVGEGMGLGLSIAHSIAERHGGTLAYEDPAGGGACFVLSLPLPGTEVTRES